MSSQPPEPGPTRRGPEFAPPTADGPGMATGPGPYPPLGRGHHPMPGGGPKPEPPPSSRWPTIITFGVIGLVAAIVLIAVLRPHPDVVPDSTADSPTPSAQAAPQDTGSSIGFTSSEGSGRLTLLSHHWASETGAANGAYLEIRVKIQASEGRISYGPQFFQSFDANSELFRTTEIGAPTPVLGSGYLRAGQTVTGGISFDMPRGDVTLLMSNALMESVTALRIT